MTVTRQSIPSHIVRGLASWLMNFYATHPLIPAVIAASKTRCDIERDKLRVKKRHGWWKLGNMQTRISLSEHISYANYCTTESLLRCIIIIAQSGSSDWRVSLFSEYNFNKNFMRNKVLIILLNIFYDKYIQPSPGIYAIP